MVQWLQPWAELLSRINIRPFASSIMHGIVLEPHTTGQEMTTIQLAVSL